MNKPGIYQVGTVTDDGHTVRISGWGLCYCATHCSCHGDLRINRADEAQGRLGLVKYAECRCCEAWTAEELAAVVRELAEMAELETA